MQYSSSLLSRVQIIEQMVKASKNPELLLSDTTLHEALAVIFKNPNNETDSRGIRQLIGFGAPINGLGRDKQTPLIYLASNAITAAGLKVGKNSFANIVTLLIDGKANVSAKDSSNCTAEGYLSESWLIEKPNKSSEQNQRELKTIFKNVCDNHTEFIKRRDAALALKDSDNKS
jgi:hypothetical protein